MLLKCGVGEDSWESLGLQGDATSPFWRRSTLGFLWKEWCWSWNSSTLATSCEELTHWKRLWCWEGLRAVGEGDDWGWDGWMASRTQWTWVWVNSGRWWWTGRPGVLRFMGSQRVGHDWVTKLNWTVRNRGNFFWGEEWIKLVCVWVCVCWCILKANVVIFCLDTLYSQYIFWVFHVVNLTWDYRCQLTPHFLECGPWWAPWLWIWSFSQTQNLRHLSELLNQNWIFSIFSQVIPVFIEV